MIKRNLENQKNQKRASQNLPKKKIKKKIQNHLRAQRKRI